MAKIKYWFTRKFQQIRNVFRWLPIIWKQHDFDYHYSLEVFKFQLQKQAEFLESDKAITRCAKDKAKRIRTILKLMDKVYEDDYACEYREILKEMYGENVLDVNFIEDKSRPIMYRMQFEYEKWDNAEEISQIKDELFKMSQEKQDRAHRILWKMIEKDIRGFWD
jgi:hypothetical protein